MRVGPTAKITQKELDDAEIDRLERLGDPKTIKGRAEMRKIEAKAKKKRKKRIQKKHPKKQRKENQLCCIRG